MQPATIHIYSTSFNFERHKLLDILVYKDGACKRKGPLGTLMHCIHHTGPSLYLDTRPGWTISCHLISSQFLRNIESEAISSSGLLLHWPWLVLPGHVLMNNRRMHVYHIRTQAE